MVHSVLCLVSLECAIDLEFLSVCACLIASLVFSGVSVWKSSQHVMQLPENIISRYNHYITFTYTYIHTYIGIHKHILHVNVD